MLAFYINCDYVLALAELNNKKLSVKKLPVFDDEHDKLCDTVQELRDDENCTCAELTQKLPSKIFVKGNEQYNFMSGFDYAAEGFHPARNCEKLSYDEAQRLVEKRCRDKLSRYKRLFGDDVETGAMKDDLLKKADAELKKEYVDKLVSCNRRHYLDRAFKQAQADPAVKLVSYDAQGEQTYNLPLGADFNIKVATCFGEGDDSYFDLIVTYQDLVLAPWSYLFKFENVDLKKLCSYTQRYWLRQDSWDPLFSEIKDIYNRALSDPKTFVKDYVKRETDEMMRKMREMLKDPRAFLVGNKFVNPGDEKYYWCRITGFQEKYAVKAKDFCEIFPEQTAILFKVEKVLQVLEAQELLKQSSCFNEDINDFIAEMQALLPSLSAEIMSCTNAIEDNIAYFEKQCAIALVKIDKIGSKLEDLDLKRQDFMRSRGCEREGSMLWHKLNFEFQNEHPLFSKLEGKRSGIKEELKALKRQIDERWLLIERFTDCHQAFFEDKIA